MRRLLCMLTATLLTFASPARGQSSAESEVQAAVTRFLQAAGRNDVDAMAAMFARGASIASAALRDGKWVTRAQSFNVWIAAVRAAPNSAPYEEPVREFTVHVDDGRWPLSAPTRA